MTRSQVERLFGHFSAGSERFAMVDHRCHSRPLLEVRFWVDSGCSDMVARTAGYGAEPTIAARIRNARIPEHLRHSLQLLQGVASGSIAGRVRHN
jgi:hypothetical protein